MRMCSMCRDGALQLIGRPTCITIAAGPFLQMDYNNIAVALLATVAGLRTFSAGRAVFYREAASGLNRCAVARQRCPTAACTAAAHDLLTSVMVAMAVSSCRHETAVCDRVLCCIATSSPYLTFCLPISFLSA